MHSPVFIPNDKTNSNLCLPPRMLFFPANTKKSLSKADEAIELMLQAESPSFNKLSTNYSACLAPVNCSGLRLRGGQLLSAGTNIAKTSGVDSSQRSNTSGVDSPQQPLHTWVGVNIVFPPTWRMFLGITRVLIPTELRSLIRVFLAHWRLVNIAFFFLEYKRCTSPFPLLQLVDQASTRSCW